MLEKGYEKQMLYPAAVENQIVGLGLLPIEPWTRLLKVKKRHKNSKWIEHLLMPDSNKNVLIYVVPTLSTGHATLNT